MALPIEKDRRAKLLASTTLNGIDFVEIASPDEKTLRVHFVNVVVVKGTLTARPTISGGETIPTVSVRPINPATDWTVDVEGRPVLILKVNAPGDFSNYTLTIASTILDPYFNHVVFSFKALCPSDLDCQVAPPPCAVPQADTPPIDYLAKDFLSFRKALSDFSALRYPEWQERSEADFGMMFMEALCGLADDLSYTQDRIAAESTLETATQRRSIVRLARLVDYEPGPPTAARVLLQFDVTPGSAPIAAGLRVTAQEPNGQTIEFETGEGLGDQSSYAVNEAWNRGIRPYFWDDSQRCVHAGATEMWVRGHNFNFDVTHRQRLLIETAATVSADPPTRELVRLIDAREEVDPLFGEDVTHIFWRAKDALRFNHDISLDEFGNSRTTLAGNFVPATQGRRVTESFAIEIAPAGSPLMALAIVRNGPNSKPNAPSPQYLFTLRERPLVWLDQTGGLPLPEIALTQEAAIPIAWRWHRRLLTSEPFESAFTVDAARFARIAENSDGSIQHDYDGDSGDTIRFGDGVFGDLPEPGTVFTVRYRVGGGARGNVAADSIKQVDPLAVPAGLRVTNPFPAQGGADAELDEPVRRQAPQAFRARQFRAVRTTDYESAAESLPWVQQAGTVFRWTGSWPTVFTTVDPRGSEEIPVDEHEELIDLLNRYRLAGYESYAPAPHYSSLDIVVGVCAQAKAFRGDVEAAVINTLSTRRLADGTTGFFHADRFTFGTPLERSSLEAAIQAARGVSGVIGILVRQRGRIPAFVSMPTVVRPHRDEILRVDSDPSRPERGSLKVVVLGGK